MTDMTDYERGFAEAIEKAVEVAMDLRDKWCKPAGTKEEEAAWDQCQRILHAIRALSPSHDTVRVPREPTREMCEAPEAIPPIHAVDDLPLSKAGWSPKAIQNLKRYRAMIAEVK